MGLTVIERGAKIPDGPVLIIKPGDKVSAEALLAIRRVFSSGDAEMVIWDDTLEDNWRFAIIDSNIKNPTRHHVPENLCR